MLPADKRTYSNRLKSPAAGFACVLFAGAVSFGCGTRSESSRPGSQPAEPPIPVAPIDTAGPSLTVAELRRQLGANDNAEIRKAGGKIRYVSLFQSGVTHITPLQGLPLKYLDLTGLPIADLSPLQGMPLEELYLENTAVSDISPLAGMPLRILRMEQTPVSDISPLAGMPLRQLNLYGTKVAEIGVVAEMPLNTLWLTETAISDLSALDGKHLESLDVQNTAVSDLKVLRGMYALKRLNIAGTQVSDLSPLQGLRLERLIFTPVGIDQGLEAVRTMRSLQEVGTSFDTLMPPDQFWRSLDAGEG